MFELFHQQFVNAFPLIKSNQGDKRLVYFDNAATSQKPQRVIDAISLHYAEQNANVHRAGHRLSQQATIAFEQARTKVKHFLNANSEQEIIWTKGTTEAINLVAHSWGQGNLSQGDEIVLSYAEHHANIVPWQLVAQQTGATIKVLPLNKHGVVDLMQAQQLITERCKLLAVGHLSNVIGKLNPVTELIALAKQYGAKTLIDGAQAIAHISIDIQQLDCDFYVFSAHKFYGPTGIGVLYGKKALLDAMPPYQAGGEMIKKVSFSGTSFNQLPFKFEPGTPNIAGVIGLSAALDFLAQQDWTKLKAYEQYLTDYAYQALSCLPLVKFICQGRPDIPLFSFRVEGHHQQDIAAGLDSMNIAIRGGHHCAMPLMEYLALDGCLRVSLAPYNTVAEVDYFVACLKQLTKQQEDGQAVVSNSQQATEPPANSQELLTEIEYSFTQAKGWQQRHRLIMLLSKKLERLPASARDDDKLIGGCESDTWLDFELDQQHRLHFSADSDAKVVRGLLVIMLAVYQGKTASEIVAFDLHQYFEYLGIKQQLSPSRSNGVKAIVERIKAIAYQELDNYAS